MMVNGWLLLSDERPVFPAIIRRQMVTKLHQATHLWVTKISLDIPFLSRKLCSDKKHQQ